MTDFVMGELRCIASIKIRSFLLLCSRISKKKKTAESSIKEAFSACWALEYSVWDSAFLKNAYHTFTAVTAFFFLFFLTVKVGQGQWVWCLWHGHSLCVTVPWLSYTWRQQHLCIWRGTSCANGLVITDKQKDACVRGSKGDTASHWAAASDFPAAFFFFF